MVFETNKDKGRAGLSAAIAYFGMNGYTVSIPLNDTQNYDLVIEKDNIFQKVHNVKRLVLKMEKLILELPVVNKEKLLELY